MFTATRRAHGLRLVIAAGAALIALALPAPALAHDGAATVSCTGAHFTFTGFGEGSNTVHYRVTVDDVVVAHGDFVLNESGGTEGSLHVPLSIVGTHKVEAFAWWGPEGVVYGHYRPDKHKPLASEVLTCAAPAPLVPPAPPTPPAALPAAAPAPASGVAGVQAQSPARVAALRVPTRCQSRRARVTVTGRSIRAVRFSVNGRPVLSRPMAVGQRRLTVSLPLRRVAAAQPIRVRVTFRNGARARTLTAMATRCAQAPVQPVFTG